MVRENSNYDEGGFKCYRNESELTLHQLTGRKRGLINAEVIAISTVSFAIVPLAAIMPTLMQATMKSIPQMLIQATMKSILPMLIQANLRRVTFFNPKLP
ncbi:hypothetical protein H5410_057161 [Solanum commersonii]|uniref:Uncharacterized protein n=1 Tax=Solanum commersonii TaxID=4109 RepID=A0A9J5WM67_SOLCO|nr:hypothetical protein H5410_057161 [Solanum commersonii]